MNRLLIVVIRLLTYFFYIFPINEKNCILTSFNGRLYSCSPKYIAEGLLQSGEDFKVFFAVQENNKDDIPAQVNRIRYRSLKHFYYLMTSKFIIFNCTGISSYLPYRKKQVIIQTWHGGYSFKVIGNDFNQNKNAVKQRCLAGKTLTYFLSSSHLATEQHSSSMSTPKEKFLEIGLPRNDILFLDHAIIRKKIFSEFQIEESKKIVLYAPTFRDDYQQKGITDYGIETIDDEAVVNALSKRFSGNYVFMYKAHHNMLPTNLGLHSINASGHSDIQDLMCAADVIITDYSSCMADFALQRKPGFLFTPDLNEYSNRHPLSMIPEEWPYQIAKSNNELIRNIENYDEENGLRKIEDFFERIGNCDKGNATDTLISIMKTHRNNKII